MFVGFDELETMIQNLRPEGVWMSVGVQDKAQADAVMSKLLRWK
jgi:hypothetical protein